MPRPLAVALLSTWHVHAADYARQAAAHPGVRLAAVWDPDGPDGAALAVEHGAAEEPDLEALLADPALDGVVVTTPTADHVDVIGRALRAGKHVFTEKLLAPTAAAAQDLVDLARERGRALVVSLPRLSEPAVLAAGTLVDEGALGRLTYARVRMAHDGWVAGWLPERFADPHAAIGGAFTDLGAHPAYLLQRFLGARPSTVRATYASVTGRAVEDNAVVTAVYPGGSIGVAEASFTTTPGASAIELRGTRGSALVGFGGERLIAKGDAFDADTWTEVPLPEPGRSPFDLWVAAATDGADPGANLAAAVDLSRFVEAANTSAASGADTAV